MNSALSIAPVNADAIKISLTQDALTLREQVFLASKNIAEIKTPEDMEACNPVIRMLKGALKDMEDSRKDVKGPVTALGKSIDTVAAEYALPLLGEETRIKLLISEYLVQEQKKGLAQIRSGGTVSDAPLAGKGIAAVDVWYFEIEDLEKAYKANKGLFDLVPKRTAIINAGKAGFAMKHIRVFKTTGVRVTGT